MQPINLQEKEIISCISTMITYGIELSNSTIKKPDVDRNKGRYYNQNYKEKEVFSNIFKPDFENILMYHGERPKVILISNSSKTLMEQSYEFVKSRMQILKHEEYDGDNNENRQLRVNENNKGKNL